MAAFCGCCGTEITDRAEACSVCGTPRHGMIPSGLPSASPSPRNPDLSVSSVAITCSGSAKDLA